jgi:hypothetical protein
MPERINDRTNTGLMVGGAFVLLGMAALLGELNTSLADVVLKLWPAGVIGVGVALLLKPGRRIARRP